MNQVCSRWPTTLLLYKAFKLKLLQLITFIIILIAQRYKHSHTHARAQTHCHQKNVALLRNPLLSAIFNWFIICSHAYFIIHIYTCHVCHQELPALNFLKKKPLLPTPFALNHHYIQILDIIMQKKHPNIKISNPTHKIYLVTHFFHIYRMELPRSSALLTNFNQFIWLMWYLINTRHFNTPLRFSVGC